MIKGLILFSNYGDGIYVNESIKNSKTCVIIGAGLIGVEMAEAFRIRGMDVTLVKRSDHILTEHKQNPPQETILPIHQMRLERYSERLICPQNIRR